VDSEELAVLFVESNAAVECSKSLLTWLLDKELVMPEVVIHETRVQPATEPPKPNIEAIKLNNRLQKASKILQKKRERQH
jgi:hypothetical protein